MDGKALKKRNNNLNHQDLALPRIFFNTIFTLSSLYLLIFKIESLTFETVSSTFIIEPLVCSHPVPAA